jgi:integrase
MRDQIRVHLVPFFGDKLLSEITPGLVQEYRIHRASSRKDEETGEARRPARSTLHQEVVTLRHVLKTANRHGWLPYLPNLSAPYKASGKISHRAWFSPQEYKKLYSATRKKIADPKNKRWRTVNENLHDYVLFMANTGLRPDEAARLEFRDVAIVTDEATGERILEIEVRGKRGVGYCKSMNGAVLPFERLRRRAKPQPTDHIFGKTPRMLLNGILKELNLKKDRDGNTRTAYSLRHTYICLRLMEGADIYQVAKNCRTSVEMIEKFYASHIKNTLDAAAINVRKSTPHRSQSRKTDKKRSR